LPGFFLLFYALEGGVLVISITSALQHLQAAMADREDHAHAIQIGQLLHKLQRNKAIIAMCGHFSAGKSSLINTMCGVPVLASGPIPTSANLVMIEHTEQSQQEVIVQYKEKNNGVPRRETAPLEHMNELSKNGLDIEQIDIHLSVPLLANQLVLLDTPGVDSTDDAHRLSTESALHLADVVFYVTDYNHVLSEVNFNFTKRLKDWGKPVYMIINQVDKHNEHELPFEQFVADVKNAFADWGIEADGYLFISVKQPSHPRSEWHKLLGLFEQFKLEYESIVQSSVILSCSHIVKEHVHAIYPEPILPELEQRSIQEIQSQFDHLQSAMDEAAQAPSKLRQQFRDELARLVNNANIIPPTAREFAASYLQSRKPGFRVGILFSDTKTKAEAAERLRLLTELVQDQTDKQLIWHLNHLIQSYKQLPDISPILLKHRVTIPDIKLDITSEWIASQVNTAAGFTNEYTMIFSAQLADQLKASYRKQASELFEQIVDALEAEAKQARTNIQPSKDELNALLTQFLDAERFVDERNDYRKKLLIELDQVRSQELSFPDPDTIRVVNDVGLPLSIDMNSLSPNNTDSSAALSHSFIESDEGRLKVHTSEQSTDKFQYRKVMEQMAKRLSQAEQLIEPLQSLAGIRRSLVEKAKKLQDHQFTIALFGAFSAGKSSFANALMGQAILPVSPNPTTAAINRIVPVNEQRPHLSALIRMKTTEAVLADIRYSFNMLGDERSFEAIEQAIHAIRTIDLQRVTSRGKVHVSFLQAILRGWDDSQHRLGTEWTADEAEYKQHVANESKSCFVERIDLHYSSSFTDQGVILVDTPGADSIHARHTGVAFDYIKNADAIFFVTYYNHAFSQADKQFLLQLGRVKDSFELDKMFFVINAADLAASKQELDEVIDHVSQQLQQHGIRNPRIFPISSRLALDARMKKDEEGLFRSGMQSFEDSFSAFAVKELAGVTLRSAELELEKVMQAIRNNIQQSQLSAEQLEINNEHRRSLLPIIEGEIKSNTDLLHADAIRQELIELLHYVKQRCSFRFGEWYNDAFHPSSLQEDGRNMNAALKSAWRQLQQSASIEVSQEVLATSLRMENYVRLQLRNWESRLLTSIMDNNESFIPEDFVLEDFVTPAVGERIAEPDIDDKVFRKHFKNAKSFFEGDGKGQLKPVLQAVIDTSISVYVAEHEQQLLSYYEQLFLREAQRFAALLNEQFRVYCNGFTYNDNTVSDLLDIETKLTRILHENASFE
jgi:GTPase Era involved in 16S rRNA processing